MQIYKIALYFAAVGIIFGSLQYIMVDIGGDNWFDQNAPNVENFTISASDIENLQFDGDSGIEDNSIGMMKYGNILFRLLQGVFAITTLLSPHLSYYVNGIDLFFPILLSFQGMIYIIYIVGALQFISNRQLEGMA